MEKGTFCSFNDDIFTEPHRIAYSVFLRDKLKQLYSNHNLQVMYDIACVLVKHLKVCLLFVTANLCAIHIMHTHSGVAIPEVMGEGYQHIPANYNHFNPMMG